MKTILSIGLALTMIASAAVQPGCVAVAAAGAAGGTVAYLRGDLEATLPSGMDETQQAVRNAIEDLDLASVSSKEDRLTAEYVARTAKDERVTIALERETDDSTAINIRVGRFGDRDRSLQIYDAISERLPD